MKSVPTKFAWLKLVQRDKDALKEISVAEGCLSIPEFLRRVVHQYHLEGTVAGGGSSKPMARVELSPPRNTPPALSSKIKRATL